MLSTDLTLTFTGLAVCALICLYSYKQHFAKHDSVKPRMIPWSIVGLASLSTAFMLLVHLANLMGFETGRR